MREGGRICRTLRYSFVWSPNSYLLQCFQALVHLQGISQHRCSLRSNFIVAETVEEKSIIIHASKLSCDNGLVLIMWFLTNQKSVRQLQGSHRGQYHNHILGVRIHSVSQEPLNCTLLLVGVAYAFGRSAMCNKVWEVWEWCQSVRWKKWAKFWTLHHSFEVLNTRILGMVVSQDSHKLSLLH